MLLNITMYKKIDEIDINLRVNNYAFIEKVFYER